MRYLIKAVVVCCLLVLSGCNNENAPECFREAGSAVVYDVAVAEFSSIHISAGVELVVVQGDQQQVTIHTGENLKEFISASVTDGQLFITNANNCNWTRDYNTTTVHVTTPVLERIYSASQFSVRSQGVLTFPELTLQSGLFSETASGTFELAVQNNKLTIDDNQNCYYKITGTTNELAVNFYAGDARFEGSGLTAQNVSVFHRSSNDIIVHPVQQVTGTIYSTGNLVLKNHPPVVTVEQLYSGHIVYN